MMEQENQTYVAGFNSGYKLQRYSPELLEKLRDSLDESKDYDRGLLEGAREWDREKEKARLAELDQINGGREQEQDQEPEIE